MPYLVSYSKSLKAFCGALLCSNLISLYILPFLSILIDLLGFEVLGDELYYHCAKDLWAITFDD